MSAIHRCDDDQGSSLTFIVRRTNQSHWLVSTPDHSTGGFFRSAEDAKRFARSEARLRKHGEVVVMGDDCLDVEVFEQAHKIKVFHLDAPRSTAPGRAS
jgi:hypothetical protein